MSTAPVNSRYFINAGADFFFIGGFSIVLFVLLAAIGPSVKMTTLVPVAAALQYIVNFPHFSATIYRLYRSSDNIRQFPLTSLVWPLIIAIFATASLALPTLAAPCFMTIYLLWSPYHFSGQTVGLTMVYARRSGYMIGRKERLALSSFVFGTFFVLYARAGVKARILTDPAAYDAAKGGYMGVPYLDFMLPHWVYIAALCVMIAGGVVFVTQTMLWMQKNKRALPLILYLPAASQLVWFVMGYGMSVWTFCIFVSLFHGLQYLYVAWAIQLRETSGAHGMNMKKLYDTSILWFGANVMGGVILFLILPMALSRIFDTPEPSTFAIVFAAVQIHHFFVDGVIWKLRNKNIADGLTMNIPQWVDSAKQAQGATS